MKNIDIELKNIIKNSIDAEYQSIDISESTNLIHDLGLDSISIMSLILEIENAFDIEINNYDLDIICEYDSLNKMVEQLIENGENIDVRVNA